MYLTRLLRPAALLTLALGLTLGQSPPAYTNPVVTPVAADPDVLRAPDGTYYLYATQDDWGDGQGSRLVPIWRSSDLVNWEYQRTAFELPPAWKEGGGFLWAPDVHRRGDTYLMFYSSSVWDDPNPCIGLATSRSPAGPFEDVGRAFFCSWDIGVSNSIDPFLFNDPQRPVLFWGSFNGIFAVPLSPDARRVIGEKAEVADSRFEGTFVHKRGGYYYLFVSSGSCCEGENSTYALSVGRSRSLQGPYLDREGNDLRFGGGTRILERNAAWVGPGHNSLVTDDAGTDWLIYHAIPADNPRVPSGANRRPALLDRLEWQGGWPTINRGGGPSAAPRPAPIIRAR